jgi:hypothetical protein
MTMMSVLVSIERLLYPVRRERSVLLCTGRLFLYQGSGAAAPAALTTRIVDSRNQAVFEQRAPLFDAPGIGPRSADYEVTLPLAKFSPGEYLLTFEAGGQKPAAARDIRFTVK